MILSHPRGPELGAWFDGEDGGQVGGHVTRCRRCQRRLSDMARVRAWMRAQPFFAMGEEPAPALASTGGRWRLLLVPAVILLVVSLLALDRQGGERSARASSRTLERAGPLAPAVSIPPEEQAGGEGSEAGGAQGLRGAGPTASPGTAGPRAGGSALRLGLVVPRTGPAGREGAEVEQVVRRRVDVANASGGVGGAPVELVVAPAEDQAGVAALAKKVTALVGGFGATAPPAATWVLPADPSVSGPSVVAIEPRPRVVGERVAEMLRRQGLTGPVGVVVGTGPDSALADGLAAHSPVTKAAARGTSCATEVASLRAAGSQALAIAGPPELAARCLKAAAASSWRPPFGTVVTPSAAYGRLETAPEAWGARSLLALPWPSAPLPGAARFRSSADSGSYRALVSFAAVELAIDVARQQGAISPAGVAGANWRSDLVDLRGTTSRSFHVVAGPAGWLPTPEGLQGGPLTVVPWLPPVPGLP